LGQADPGRYFPETGHYVSGEFLTYYESHSNPELLFGNPISIQFGKIDKSGNTYLVQYFERARFELHPGESGLPVRLSLIGGALASNVGEMSMPEDFQGCEYFPQTGKSVCFAFLKFFQENGGAAQFGYPVTNRINENDYKSVQYFQRAKFEFHPAPRDGQLVTLANIGEEYFHLQDEDPRHLMAEIPFGSAAPQTVISLQVHAFAENAVVSRSDSQTVYIIVYDQRNIPVENADATLNIRFPGGGSQRIIVPNRTDSNGIVQYQFSYEDSHVGEAEIFVRISSGDLVGQTVTGFRVWW
jgi:hypothetical protein